MDCSSTGTLIVVDSPLPEHVREKEQDCPDQWGSELKQWIENQDTMQYGGVVSTEKRLCRVETDKSERKYESQNDLNPPLIDDNRIVHEFRRVLHCPVYRGRRPNKPKLMVPVDIIAAA